MFNLKTCCLRRPRLLAPSHLTMGRLPRRQIRASLPVQLLLYYNSLFSLVYFFIVGTLVVNKLANYKYHSGLQRGSTGPAFVLWMLTEPARIYYGYSGNLQEKVPQMSAFLLMTFFPQIPCIIFFTFFQEHIFPFDQIAGCIMVILLVLEVIFGFMGLQVFIRQQTAQFYRQCNESIRRAGSNVAYEALSSKED